jgi:hypothetical protein
VNKIIDGWSGLPSSKTKVQLTVILRGAKPKQANNSARAYNKPNRGWLSDFINREEHSLKEQSQISTVLSQCSLSGELFKIAKILELEFRVVRMKLI